MDEIETINLKPIITNGLIGIHKVISHGLSVAGENKQNIIQQNNLKTQPLNGFLDYLRSLTIIINSHHC